MKLEDANSGPIFLDCHKCGRNVRMFLGEYDYFIYEKDSDSLHSCFVKERSTD